MQQQQSWSIQISPPTKIARTAYCDLIDSCDTIVWIRAAKERVQSPPQQQWLGLAWLSGFRSQAIMNAMSFYNNPIGTEN